MTTNAKVLAVDDREDNLVALAAVLDSLPVEVVPAGSGRAALKELLTDDFALILLDVVMPGMDGFETAGHIKSRPRTRDIPIIFLTANGQSPEQVFRGYASGAADYLTKPFDPWLLRTKVSVFVDLHRKNQQLVRQAALLRQAVVAGGGGPSPCERLMASLTERLCAAEELVRSVRPAEGEAEPFDRLEGHIAHLRTALDALAAP